MSRFNSDAYSGLVTEGIDVSYAQADINWDEAKNDSRVNFAIIRIGDGVGIDRYFRQNISACKRLGIPVGTYRFLRARTPQRGVAQADAELINEFGGVELITAIDIEAGSANGVLGSTITQRSGGTPTREQTEIVVQRAKEYLETMESLGFKGMVYGGGSLITLYSVSPGILDPLAPWPLWRPAYNRGGAPKPLGSGVRVPPPWTKWTMHQYTSRAVITGVGQNTVDVNRLKGDLRTLTDPAYRESFIGSNTGTGGRGASASTFVAPVPRDTNRERRQRLTRGRTNPNDSTKYAYFIVSGSDPNTDGVLPDRSVVRSPFDKFYNQITDLRSLSTLEMNSVVPILKIWTTDENNNIVDLNQLIFSQTPLENFSDSSQILPSETKERPIASIESFDVNVQTPSVGGPTGIITGKLSIVVHNTNRVNKNDPKGKFIHWMFKQGLHLRIRFGNNSNFSGFQLPGIKTIEEDFYIAQHEVEVLDDISSKVSLTVLPAHSKLFNQILIGESIPPTEITNENIQQAISSVVSEETTQAEITSLRNQLTRFQTEFNREVRTVGTDAQESQDTDRGTSTLGSVLQGALSNDRIIFQPDGFDSVLVRNYIEGLKLIQSNFMTQRFERIAENHAYTYSFRGGLAEIIAINAGPLIWEMARPEIEKIVSITSETGIRIGQTEGNQSTEGRNKVKIIFGNFNAAAGNWAQKPISTFPIDLEDIMVHIRDERKVGRFSDSLNNFIGRIASNMRRRDFFTPIQESRPNQDRPVPRIETPEVKYIFYPDPTDDSSWIFYIYDKKEIVVNVSNLLHEIRRSNEEPLTKEQIKTKCDQYKIPWIELGSESNLVKKLGATTKADDMVMSNNLFLANNAIAQRNLDGSPNIPPGISTNFLTGVSAENSQEIIRATDLYMPIHMNMDYFGAVDSTLFGHFYIFFPVRQFSGLYTVYQLGHSIKNGDMTTRYTLQIQITDRNITHQ